MILQEEKVEIVEEEKEPGRELQPVHPNTNNSKRFLIYSGIFVGILFFILLIIFIGFTIYNLNNNNVIAKGISIYNIDVSGLTRNEAKDKISAAFKGIESTNIKLKSNEYENIINPSDISLKFNIESAVNYAFNIGKKGNVFTDNFVVLNTMINGINLTPTFSLDDKALENALNKISKELPNKVVESSYYVEGSSLIITKGKDGDIVNTAQTIRDIKAKLQDYSFLRDSVEISLSKGSPEAVNLDEVYKEVHKEAKDAYFTKNPYAVYPSEKGVDFAISMSQAKKKVAEADKECTIPLKTLYPKVTTNMIGKEAFPNLLGEFSTHYPASNVNRTTNLKLAAKKINGTVLLPGETFSYNKVVGERTISAGYKEAPIYVNGQVVDGLGGGVCQISTTLYNACLFANLKIKEAYYHQFVPSYVGPGRDATVAYGSKDFKFINSRKYAIKIECSVSGGIAKFKIYGVKEDKEYDVKVNAYVSNGASYIYASTYRTLYLNGKKVSSEKICSGSYKKHH